MGQLRPPPLSADAPPPRGYDIADVCVLVVEWQRRRRPAERAEDAGPQVGHGAGAGGGGGATVGRRTINRNDPTPFLFSPWTTGMATLRAHVEPAILNEFRERNQGLGEMVWRAAPWCGVCVCKSFWFN